jgi:hypothetical protein
MEERQLQLVGPSGLSDATLRIHDDRPPRLELISEYGDFEIPGLDLLDCLNGLVAELERFSVRPCCKGMLPNVRASGMSRSMSNGRRAYLISGESRTVVDIFDPVECDQLNG